MIEECVLIVSMTLALLGFLLIISASSIMFQCVKTTGNSTSSAIEVVGCEQRTLLFTGVGFLSAGIYFMIVVNVARVIRT